MLADQFSCSFRLLMHGASFFISLSDGRKSGRANVKNENWLQKLIYRISDNKFNSFSLFSLQSLLHHISLPAQAGTLGTSSSGGRAAEGKEHKNYQRFSLLCSVMNYTLALSSIAESVLETLAAAGWYTLLMIVTAHTWREIQVFISLLPFIQWFHLLVVWMGTQRWWEGVHWGGRNEIISEFRGRARNLDAKMPLQWLWSRQNVSKCQF